MKLLKSLEFRAMLAVLVGLPLPLMADPVSVTAPPELLEAADAFQVSARLLDPATLEIQYRIADGYYMYRERFKFAIEAGGPKLGKARLPIGKVKQDATFGRVETYRKSVRVLLPVANIKSGQSGRQESFLLLVTSQGCADAGVCYPPQRHQFRLVSNSSQTVQPLILGASATGAEKEDLGRVPAPGKFSDLIKRDN